LLWIRPLRGEELSRKLSMASLHAKLIKAQQKVKQLEEKEEQFLKRQHSVRADLIGKNPDYRRIKADLLRAKGAVRSLRRQIDK